MKPIKIIASFAFLLFCVGEVQAQQNSIPSGGEATGLGGTASYSVGQVVYTTNTGTNGSVAQGVQQPYEISTTAGINETTINLEMSVYPNPTTNYLTLKTEDNSNLSYQLYDLQGKVIENKKINANSTTIKMEALPNAVYLLKIKNNSQIVKSFKIIKN
jgi:hypothetical protein